MFRKNEKHRQPSLFSWQYVLPPAKWEALQKSTGYYFYQNIFCKIDENLFACLYSNKDSAPNAPVNCLVAAILLKHLYNWSMSELMDAIMFNISIRMALGLQDLHSEPFTERTYYNFQSRLLAHYEQKGENLLTPLFDQLSKVQLKELGVKTNIQRIDSVLLETNIRDYSRISLLAELIYRLYRQLPKEVQKTHIDLFAPYKKGGEKYVYTLKESDQPTRLGQLATDYALIAHYLASDYSHLESYQHFARGMSDHFVYDESLIEVDAPLPLSAIAATDLASNTLQSPDDLDATHRTKRKESHVGYALTASETCHPDNEINLVTHVAVTTNNTDDAAVLAEELPQMIKKTPDLDELHQDGGFGNEAVDIIAEQADITLVQTAIKGVAAIVPMEISEQVIEETDSSSKKQQESLTQLVVNCPYEAHPPVVAKKAKVNHRADFDLKICVKCPFYDQCPTRKERKQKKQVGVLRFKRTQLLKQKRHKAIQKIPPERRTIRAGVESTMRQFRQGENNGGKLKVRESFSVELYGFAMAMMINFKRILRYKTAKNSFFDSIGHYPSLWLWRAMIKLKSVTTHVNNQHLTA